MNAAALRAQFNRTPDRPFLGAIAEPTGSSTTQPPIGVIVMGMGVADMQAVKRFGKLGFVAMQIRLIREPDHHADMYRRHATYDASGIERCRSAMDLLTQTHGVQRFVLMGNCALANIAWNTARSDERVAGVILSNPYVPSKLMSGLLFKLRHHVMRWSSWTRLFSGRMKLASVASAVQGEPATPQASGPQGSGLDQDFSQDLLLAPHFDRELAAVLATRNLQALLVFSRGDPVRDYFRRYARTLRRLVTSGKLRHEVVATDNHDFSAGDDSASALLAVIADWAARTIQHLTPAATPTPVAAMRADERNSESAIRRASLAV